MTISENVPLTNYSTMRLGGSAAYLCEVTTRMEILEALTWAQQRTLPVIMIGTGSNIIWRDEGFAGLVIVNKILRFELFKEDETNTYLTIGAGEPWDSVVARSVQAGLSGIEALSLIPGTAGATPIQNVGAYGQDISQTLVTVEAFDTQVGDSRHLTSQRLWLWLSHQPFQNHRSRPLLHQRSQPAPQCP